MLSYKLKITNSVDILKYQQDYTHIVRKSYNNSEKLSNKSFIDSLISNHFCKWIMWCAIGEAELKLKETSIHKKRCEDKILTIDKKLEIELDKRTRYKLIKKLSILNSNLSKDIVFGNKELLKEISRESNKKDSAKLIQLKEKWKKNRILPLSITGEANCQGNRKFIFDLKNNRCVFKPKCGISIPIDFQCSKKRYKDLCKLQDLGDKYLIPISVHLSSDFICLSFDEEKLNDFHFKEVEFKRELKKIPKSQKLERTALARSFHLDQRERQLRNKNPNRYMAVDLNPQYVGWSILDKQSNKIVDKGCYDLSQLSTKLRLSSSDPKQLHQNNKRKYEISCVWKNLFNKASHYKVAYFGMEELSFKPQLINTNSREANRKTKNIWHRSLATRLITKYCNTLGIQLINVNPAYSSFIGNIQHSFFDPVNASIEIVRRCAYKFEKGQFYPTITESDLAAMSSFIEVSDVSNKNELLMKLRTTSTWVGLYGLFKQAKIKYRRILDQTDHKILRFFTSKSEVNSLVFD